MYDRAMIPLSPNPIIPENTNGISVHDSNEFNAYKKGEEKAAAGKSVSDDYARTLRHAYFASVSYVDAQIGKVLQELEKLELEDNTIVVVWGDHGWHLGDQTIWGKHSTFERALRSALIIKVPGTKGAGSQAKGLVESIDIYPTLCELCGNDTPQGVDGVSLTPVFNDPGYKAKEAAYSYWNNGLSVRTDRYRLSCFYCNGNEVIELYDHCSDPNEAVNMAAYHPEKVDELMPILRKGDTGIFKRN